MGFDITRLFGKVVPFEYGDINIHKHLPGPEKLIPSTTFNFHQDRFGNRREVKVAHSIHLYPFNPWQVKWAKEEDFEVVGVFKELADPDKDYPALFAICHWSGDDHISAVVAEDIDNSTAFMETGMWSMKI